MFEVLFSQMKKEEMQHTGFSGVRTNNLRILNMIITQYRFKDYWGFEIAMIDELSKVLDFSYEVINPPDGQWGLIDEDGRWNGKIGMAARGEVDFIMGDILMSFNRFQVISVNRKKNCIIN